MPARVPQFMAVTWPRSLPLHDVDVDEGTRQHLLGGEAKHQKHSLQGDSKGRNVETN